MSRRYATTQGQELPIDEFAREQLRVLACQLLDRRESDEFVFLGGIGSQGRATLYNISKDTVFCGCFRGTLAQFKDKVHNEYQRGSAGYIEYQGAIEFLEAARKGCNKRLCEPAKVPRGPEGYQIHVRGDFPPEPVNPSRDPEGSTMATIPENGCGCTPCGG